MKLKLKEVMNFELSFFLFSGASYKFRVLAVYEDDDNKNSPSTTTFRLTIVPHAQARPPETAPMIVEATPVFYQETYGIGVKWQVIGLSLTFPLFGLEIIKRFHCLFNEKFPFNSTNLRQPLLLKVSSSSINLMALTSPIWRRESQVLV